MGPLNANHGGFTVVRFSLLRLLRLLLRRRLAVGFGLFRRLRQFHHFCRVLLAVHVLKQQLSRGAANVATAFPGMQHWERRELPMIETSGLRSNPEMCSQHSTSSVFLRGIRKHFNGRINMRRIDGSFRPHETWHQVILKVLSLDRTDG